MVGGVGRDERGSLHKGGVSVGLAMEMVAGKPLSREGAHQRGEGASGREEVGSRKMNEKKCGSCHSLIGIPGHIVLYKLIIYF